MKPIIYIAGITHRSGTNFLLNALLCHKDCVATHNELWEDFILTDVTYLQKYVLNVESKWNKKWNISPAKLYQHIGNGISDFLRIGIDDSMYLVTKTPVTYNIHCLKTLMPHAKLVIVVRHGLETALSGAQGLHWNYSKALNSWNISAQRILRNNHEGLVVKYESLLNNQLEQINHILAFCGLDKARLDTDLLQDLPYYGSSQLAKKGELHWKPVDKKDHTTIASRADKASWQERSRYIWICQNNALKLGYTAMDKPNIVLHYLFNIAMDIKEMRTIKNYMIKRTPPSSSTLNGNLSPGEPINIK